MWKFIWQTDDMGKWPRTQIGPFKRIKVTQLGFFPTPRRCVQLEIYIAYPVSVISYKTPRALTLELSIQYMLCALP